MWDLLVCPFDHSPLDAVSSRLTCRECGRGFPITEGVPTFLCRADDTRLCGRSTAQRPALRLRSGTRRPESRAWERLIARYAPYNANSRLLQLGACAGGLEQFGQGRRYAVDPSAIATPAVQWIAACAHDLPFCDETFDAVLMGPSCAADVALSARLTEAARCLASEGILCVALERAPQAGRRLVEAASACGLQLAWSCAAGGASSAYLFRRGACYSPPLSAGILAGKLRLAA